MRALIVSGLFIIFRIIGEFIILLIISGLFITPPNPPIPPVDPNPPVVDDDPVLPNPEDVVDEVEVFVAVRVAGGVVSLKLLIKCSTSPLFTL